MFGFLMQCWYSSSYHNNRYIFGQGDMTCLRSSKTTLKTSKTKYPQNIPIIDAPYKVIPSHPQVWDRSHVNSMTYIHGRAGRARPLAGNEAGRISASHPAPLATPCCVNDSKLEYKNDNKLSLGPACRATPLNAMLCYILYEGCIDLYRPMAQPRQN